MEDIDTLERPVDNVPDVNVPVDYFGFASTKIWYLPDRVQWMELKVLNEGERRQYLNESNREVKFAKGSGDAAVKMRPGDDKATLLKLAIKNWNMIRNGEGVAFHPAMLDQFLKLADPKIIDLIEKEVKGMNPWLLSEMSLEDIDREMAQLQEMRDKKVEEEEGKALS